MNERRWQNLVAWALRLGLGTLFIVAGALKARDPGGFAQEIANYQLWPALAPYVALVLPSIEIVAGAAVLLLGTRWRRAGALVVAGLVVVFTVAVVSSLARGLNIDCACFGGGTGPITWLTVVRNLALLAAAAALLVLERPRRPVIVTPA